MKIEKTAKLIMALSAFQTVASTVAASEIKSVFVAQNSEQAVICDVSKLNKNKTINEWPGSADGKKPQGSNAQILQQIDKEFAGGKYFDSFPHKLPELFEAGACLTVRAASAPDVTPSAARRVALTKAQQSKFISVAGVLEARASESEVRLAGRVIVKPSESKVMGGQDSPSFVELFENAAGYDQVIVIRWDGMGNACNGYGYTFVGLRKDGTHAVQAQDYCGGPPPQITLYNKGAGILFATPDSPPNRGTGIVKGEKSVFMNGTLRRL